MLAGGGLEQWLALIAKRASELSDADGITVSVLVEEGSESLKVIATHGAPVSPFGGATGADRGIGDGAGLHHGPG